MFLSYEYIHPHRYKIIDSDFELTFTYDKYKGALYIADVIIQEYNKRNLNVAANLFRLAQFIKKTYGYCFERIFNSWKRYVPEYKKYEDEMQKYLILIE